MSSVSQDDRINILYCGDSNIADGVLLSVLSLLRHTDRPLMIYLLTAKVQTARKVFLPLSATFADYLHRLVGGRRPDSGVKLFDITGLLEAQPPTANMETRFTPCCMLRLYADLVPELPDKLLYLDNDVLCRANFSSLYDHDVSGFDLGGVPDYYGRWFFCTRPFSMDYFNSGVLLLNLARIRREGLFAACRQRCQRKRMVLPDQSAINTLAVKKLHLQRRYNEQRRLRADTVFQHFTSSYCFSSLLRTSSVKPWQVERMHRVLKLHEYDDLLEEFQRVKLDYKLNADTTSTAP